MLNKQDMSEVREELSRLHERLEHDEVFRFLGTDKQALWETAEEATAWPAFEDPQQELVAIFIAAVHFGMLLERRRAQGVSV